MVRSSLGQKSCCWMRLPHSAWIMLKLIFSDASAAEKSLTGMDTSPKAIWPDANALGIWRAPESYLDKRALARLSSVLGDQLLCSASPENAITSTPCAPLVSKDLRRRAAHPARPR